jgi:taurine--2-oxoglutarate transaminase
VKTDEMIELCKKHTLYTWSATGAVDPLPIAGAEGIYLYTPEGDRIIDFNSQLMCVNIGHGHPKVRAAMKQAVDGLIYAFPGSATPVRARVGKLLAEMMPDPLNTFFFTLGGAEANENAIRAAKLYTGRNKILARYRSYHGATNACMQLTGDPRRLKNEPGMPGVVHVFDPRPYHYSFGETPEERTVQNLKYLEETILYEGPETIAAMIVETITGTNGVLPPPPGYMKGLKAILERHGILLICDEVMAGWGRTGKLMAFEHYDFVPDIVSMAKGLTSAYVPLGCVGLADHVADHFRENVFWGGLTYGAHPLALATAEAVIEVMREEKLVENAARLEPIMTAHMQRMKDRHPSVKEFRCIGLFGMVDLQRDSKGTPMAGYNSTSPEMKALAQFFRDNHLFTFVRWGSFMCNPPLCITEEQMEEAFEIIDRALEVTDQAFEG